ncbi:hypothetical protein GW17_00054249, partial [Ensete ventricosum]
QDLKEGGNPDAVAAAEVRAAEAQSVAERLRIELDEANSRQASAEAELEKSRSESASLERQLADLRERLGDSEGQLWSARARVCQMETELLDLAWSKEALQEDLSKRAIEEYKTFKSRAEVSARPVLVRVRKSANVSGGQNFLHGLMLPRGSST